MFLTSMVQTRPETEVTEEEIQTSRASARRIDDFLTHSAIEFTSKSTSSSDDSSSVEEMEISVSESAVLHASPAAPDQFSWQQVSAVTIR